uniref:Uncharacterized protein n=1 Tax=Glossina austeni TaxID=7395 RepID=A0A1A9VEU5_GLOAU
MINQRVTTDDVRQKILNIKAGLRELDKKQGTTRTTLCAYLWYAHKLGQSHAADRLTKQLISDEKIKIQMEKETDDLLGFDETESSQIDEHECTEELIEGIIEEMTGEQTTQMKLI